MNIYTKDEIVQFQEGLDRDNMQLSDEIKSHLVKFDNIEILFQQANELILSYFNNQSEYNDFNEFKKYLVSRIVFYVESFSLNRQERKQIENKLRDIEEKYNELLFFGENNPIENRRTQVIDAVNNQIDK